MKNKSRKKKTADRRSKNKNNAKHVDNKVHINPNTQQTNNTSTTTNRDLKGMKEWLNSLSYESLVNALEFTFQMNEGSKGGGMGAVSTNLSTSQQSHLCEDNKRSSSGSHEFDLLMEMSSLQSTDSYDDES